jgi:hypothetical protein
MNDIEYLISRFIDNELDEEGQKKLFRFLMNDSSARISFREYIENEKSLYANFSRNSDLLFLSQLELSEKSKVKNEKRTQPFINGKKRLKGNIFYKAAFYTSAAAALILIFFLAEKKPQLQYVDREVSRVDTVYIPKERIIIRQIKVNQYPEKNNKNYLEYVNSIPLANSVPLSE